MILIEEINCIAVVLSLRW